MKKLIILLIISLPVLGFGQLMDCEKFKDGTFSYPTIANVLSIRKGKTQKSIANGKLQALWDVKWSEECKYELTCRKVKDKSSPFKVGDHIKVEIISIEGECISMNTLVFRNGVLQGETKGTQMCAE